MAKNKHLSLVDCEVIQKALDDRIFFKGIARMLDKDCSTISKKIRNHIKIRKMVVLVMSITLAKTVFPAESKNFATPQIVKSGTVKPADTVLLTVLVI